MIPVKPVNGKPKPMQKIALASFEQQGYAAISCSWCHEMNPIGERFCHSCGHRADLPRMECDCDRCKTAPPLEGGIQ